MSTSRFGLAVGIAIGAIWAMAGFAGAVVAAFLAAVGYVVGQVVEGRVDLTEFLGHRQDR
jgi:fructose-specific phosphotransferase system IIC component